MRPAPLDRRPPCDLQHRPARPLTPTPATCDWSTPRPRPPRDRMTPRHRRDRPPAPSRDCPRPARPLRPNRTTARTTRQTVDHVPPASTPCADHAPLAPTDPRPPLTCCDENPVVPSDHDCVPFEVTIALIYVLILYIERIDSESEGVRHSAIVI